MHNPPVLHYMSFRLVSNKLTPSYYGTFQCSFPIRMQKYSSHMLQSKKEFLEIETTFLYAADKWVIAQGATLERVNQ